MLPVEIELPSSHSKDLLSAFSEIITFRQHTSHKVLGQEKEIAALLTDGVSAVPTTSASIFLPVESN